MTKQELMARIIERIAADQTGTASAKELRVATAKLLSEVQSFKRQIVQVQPVVSTAEDTSKRRKFG